VVGRIVVKEAKPVVVLIALDRTHYASLRRIPKYEPVALITNDEQPMLPAISPFIAQRDRLADSAQIGLIVADPTQDSNWNDATSVQQTLELSDHLSERLGLIFQNEVVTGWEFGELTW
jgi:hypothetical protein